MSRSPVPRIIRRDGTLCHYCMNSTNRRVGSNRQATADHIVPRSLGGPNSMDNYVLACAECNVKRGNGLLFCSCDICEPKIQAVLTDEDFVMKVFLGIIAHNRSEVKRVGDRWRVKKGYGAKMFDTWDEALAAANESAPIKRRDYA